MKSQLRKVSGASINSESYWASLPSWSSSKRMWRTCLLLLRWVAGVRRCTTVWVAAHVMRLAEGRHRAGASVSQQPRSTDGTVEGLAGREAAFWLREATVGGGDGVSQVGVERRARVYEVELCPESLLPAGGVEVRGRTGRGVHGAGADRRQVVARGGAGEREVLRDSSHGALQAGRERQVGVGRARGIEVLLKTRL